MEMCTLLLTLFASHSGDETRVMAGEGGVVSCLITHIEFVTVDFVGMYPLLLMSNHCLISTYIDKHVQIEYSLRCLYLSWLVAPATLITCKANEIALDIRRGCTHQPAVFNCQRPNLINRLVGNRFTYFMINISIHVLATNYNIILICCSNSICIDY